MNIFFVLVLMIALTASAFATGLWMIEIGDLNVAVSQAVYDEAFKQALPSLFAGSIASAVARAEAEQRTSQAIHELCDHDTYFCQDVFARYGLTWKGN